MAELAAPRPERRRRPTVLIYCQHSTGLGHLVRTMAIAHGLTAHFRVVVMSGGKWPEQMRVPDGVGVVPLPPVGTGPDGALCSLDAACTLEDAHARRRDLMLDTLAATRARALIVELFPFGRRKFAGELLPLLARARDMRRGRPLVVCSVRDILVGKRRDQRAHDDNAARTVNAYFDAVLVHADPALARLEDTFQPSTPLTVPVHYTGFVSAQHASEAQAGDDGLRRVVVSAGGGLVGEPLLTAAVRAHALLVRHGRPRAYDELTVVGGPFLPDPAWQRVTALASGVPDVALRRAVDHLPALLHGAAGSVSQCGYNTALEVLRSAVPALVVPYHEAGENEQMRRACTLAARGAVRVLDPAELTPQRMANELAALAHFRPRATAVDLNGAARTATLVRSMLAAAKRAPLRSVARLGPPVAECVS